MEIRVAEAAPRSFEVEVREGAAATRHVVTIPNGYPEQIGVPGVALDRLVRESFVFLLEREPKESILGRFALPVIERYFAEYPAEIRRRLA